METPNYCAINFGTFGKEGTKMHVCRVTKKFQLLRSWWCTPGGYSLPICISGFLKAIEANIDPCILDTGLKHLTIRMPSLPEASITIDNCKIISCLAFPYSSAGPGN